MKKIVYKNEKEAYSINIEYGSIVKNLENLILKKNKKIFLIDSKVFYIFKKIKNFKKNNFIKIDCSEKIKNFKNYYTLCEKILKFGIDRDTEIISIGGGTLGDLSGFIASTILRGVDLTLFPTTLLSQVDSSVGGKNGINTKYGKNLVGTFYQPKQVFIDPEVLSTLPKRQILSGYAEIVKHSLINDKKFFNWLNKNSQKIFILNQKILTEAIYKSILIKIKYVSKDEKEKLNNKYSRSNLNFGHTFGHALEAYYKYNTKLTHGEAISIGMIIAAKISYKLNYLSLRKLDIIMNHFKSNKLPIFDSKMFDKKIFKIMEIDKKKFNGYINFVLLSDIGESFIENNINLDKIKKLLK